MAKEKLGKQNIINRENKDLFDLFEKYPEMESNFTPTTGKFIQQKNKNDFAEFDVDNYKKILFAQEIINNPDSTEREIALAKIRLQRLKKSDTSGRGKRPTEVESNQEQMERRNITESQEDPILDGDDEKKSFFDRLLSKENRPFLENLGMKLGTTLTAPMNPGENRSLINQVATSIQGASDKTAADEKAEVAKLLAGAQAKKALAESGGQTTLIKNALANVAMQFPSLDQNSDAFKQKVAQAMRQFGIKDITTAQINSYIKLSQLESELKMLNDPKDPEYIKKALEIEAFKKNLAEGGLGTGGGDGRNIVKFEDR